MKVLFLPEVRQYFKELEDILLEREYFGFEDSAVQYVRELIFDIENSLPARMEKQRLHISTGTAKICVTLLFGRTRQHNGTCFYEIPGAWRNDLSGKVH
jgi:hypothetical protein